MVNTLLRGITGSRAHGLATEISDTDRHGIYASPTTQVLGLSRPEWSRRTSDDDLMWEAGNAIRLALASNPTVLELLFLEQYEVASDLGGELVSLRDRLITQDLVRRSYLRNAESQAAKMRRRLWTMNKLDWHGDTENETREIRKRARSIAICLVQGMQLWNNGLFTVTLNEENRGIVLRAEADPVHLDGLLDKAEAVMEQPTNRLRETPDVAAAERWLLQVREAYWHAEQ